MSFVCVLGRGPVVEDPLSDSLLSLLCLWCSNSGRAGATAPPKVTPCGKDVQCSIMTVDVVGIAQRLLYPAYCLAPYLLTIPFADVLDVRYTPPLL